MQNLAAAIALGLIAAVTVAADKPPAAVAGVLLRLNQPGSIAVEISMGEADGMKVGDVLIVSRKEKLIGKLKVAKLEPDRATATITEVAEGAKFQAGDQVRK